MVSYRMWAVQIAEERALAGLCGHPRCANSLQSQKPAAHYKIQGRVVYDMEDESRCTCRYVPHELCCLFIPVYSQHVPESIMS